MRWSNDREVGDGEVGGGGLVGDHAAHHRPQDGGGGGGVRHQRDNLLQLPPFSCRVQRSLCFPLGGRLHLQMGNKCMEKERARGKPVAEQVGGGDGVLKEGVDGLGEPARLGHGHQRPVEANHHQWLLLGRRNILDLRIKIKM